MGILIFWFCCFVAGVILGAIVAGHSARMRKIAASVDAEFEAVQKSLMDKMAKAEPPKAADPVSVADLAKQLGPQEPPKP